jgi:hypothetical protein
LVREIAMASQKQAHVTGTAPSHGTGMRLRETPSIRKSKKSRKNSISDPSMDIENNGKLTRENDAAALLLGLAHSIGSPASLQEARDDIERGKDLYSSFDSKDRAKGMKQCNPERVSQLPQIDPCVVKLLTAKGHSRLGPGDNRVRPPKAATKLLNVRWRHIRLPNIQAALEAEDWVVMYGHLRNPEKLSKDKMNTMLNFHPSHYNENTMRKILESFRNTYELEHFLKDRYRGVALKKSTSKHRSLPAGQSARNEYLSSKKDKGNISEAYSMPNMSHSTSLSPQLVSLEAIKSGVPLYTKTSIYTSSKDSDENKREKNPIGVRDGHSFPPSGGLKVGFGPLDDRHLAMENYGGLSWPLLQNPSTVTDLSKTHELSMVVSDCPPNPQNKGEMNLRLSQQGKPTNLPPKNAEMKVDSNKKDMIDAENQFTFEDPRVYGAVHSDSYQTSPEEGVYVYKPGRPPSYDAMVRWCVDLKRILFQKKLNLTIDEAIALVNDSSVYACGPKTAHTKSLVASTLRKRVLGIYGITWSQVATTTDIDVNKEIKDKSIISAATSVLNRHGLNLSGRLISAEADRGNSSNLSEQNTSSSRLCEQDIDRSSIGFETESYKCTHGQVSNPAHGEKNDAILSATHCLDGRLTEISDTIKNIIEKARIQFLNFEEVAIIIKDAAQGRLPVSLQVNYKPKSGTLYLINRSKVAKFRCDGYEFKKRETHARKMLSSNERLNCYYAGGSKDKMQRRCYWLISDDCEASKDPYDTQPKDLVLIHYMKNWAWSDEPNEDIMIEKESLLSKEMLMNQKKELEYKIAEINELLNR